MSDIRNEIAFAFFWLVLGVLIGRYLIPYIKLKERKK